MRTATRPVLLLALLAAPLLGADATLAIVGATVIDPGTGTVLPGATVLVVGERIAAVGVDVAVPAGATEIDGRGRWLIPGLVDAHVHFFQSGGLYTRPDCLDLRRVKPYAQEVDEIRRRIDDTFRRYLRCGITAVADVGGPMWNFDVRERARRTAAAPRVAVAGPLMSPWQPPQLEHDDLPIVGITSIEQAVAEVRRQAERSPDFIKIWWLVGRGGGDFAPIAAAIIAESHRLRLRVAVHATELGTARAALAAGADVLVHSVDDAPIDEAFTRALVERHVAYCSTAIVHGQYGAVFDGSFRPTIAELSWAQPEALGSLGDLGHLANEDLPRWLAAVRRGRESLATEEGAVASRNFIAADRAGAIAAVGTDAGNIGTLPGPSIYREFAMLAAAGMLPMEVLRCATRGGAMLMGRGDDFGSVRPGMLADLLLIDVDPSQDLDFGARIHRIIKGGEVLDPATLIEEGPESLPQRALNAWNAASPEAFRDLLSADAVISTGEGDVRASDPGFDAWFRGNARRHRRSLDRAFEAGAWTCRYELIAPPPLTGSRERVTYRIADGRIAAVAIVGE